MRIFFKTLNTDEYIFGALIPTITRFKMHGIVKGQKVCIFHAKTYGDIYCTFEMLDRVLERYKATNQDCSILLKAKL